ncbi:MAG TPA: hypothetical protein PKD64_03655 [Pirellulaceae bacterium]|nr:hypothetical protein [Pirellulaceae bacterium]HMO91266.1 hypothetical protein [Pirellulaceae bacterium]HMP68550.1 hypothetical protein [Pirellulaceae bacterium]
MTERSRYQERVIKNYYENRDAIALQRVQEIVTEIYLSEGKKRERNWKSLELHLKKLGIAQATIDHLIKGDNPEKVAKLVQELSEKG